MVAVHQIEIIAIRRVLLCVLIMTGAISSSCGRHFAGGRPEEVAYQSYGSIELGNSSLEHSRTLMQCGEGGCWGGVGGAIDLGVIVASDTAGVSSPRVVWASLSGDSSRNLWEGAAPTVLRGSDAVVFQAPIAGRPDRSRLIVGHARSAARVETLGTVATVGAAQAVDWPAFALPAIELESGVVVVVGIDSCLWKVNVATGTWQRLGFKGLVPVMWYGPAKRLLCWPSLNGRGVVSVDLDGGEAEAIPELAGMNAYVIDETSDALTVTLVRKWPLPIEIYDVFHFTWATRHLVRIGGGIYAHGRAVRVSTR